MKIQRILGLSAVLTSWLALGCGDDATTGSTTGGGGGGTGGASTATGGGEGGSGGASSTTATTSSSTSTSTSTTSSTSTSTGQGGGTPAVLPTEEQCATECDEAKAGGCTIITGECTACCGAILALAVPASCDQETADYYACVSGNDPVCNGDCTPEQEALNTCLVGYCSGNFADPNCQTLLGCAQ
jgi:hypothetical protein